MFKESRTFKNTKNYLKRTISDNEIRIYHYVSIFVDPVTKDKMNKIVDNWLADAYQKFEYDENFNECVKETAITFMNDMMTNPTNFDDSFHEYVIQKEETNEPVMIYSVRVHDGKIESKYIFYKV